MPGRQSHGRPVEFKPLERNKRKSKSSAKANALDALATAAKQIPASKKQGRWRDLDPEPEQKRRRPDDDEGNEPDGGADAGGPRAKRQRQEDADDGSDEEMGSDSEGNEWHVGVGGDDEDSEIDSDEAFGESDEERFEGFVFRGSSSKDAAGGDGDSDEDDDDAVDLAQALDDASEDDEGSAGDSESDSEDDESNADSPDTDEEDDPSKFDALQDIVSGFAGDVNEAATDDSAAGQRPKISLEDLGLFGVKDPLIKKSLKLMKKEEKVRKPGLPRSSMCHWQGDNKIVYFASPRRKRQIRLSIGGPTPSSITDELSTWSSRSQSHCQMRDSITGNCFP